MAKMTNAQLLEVHGELLAELHREGVDPGIGKRALFVQLQNQNDLAETLQTTINQAFSAQERGVMTPSLKTRIVKKIFDARLRYKVVG